MTTLLGSCSTVLVQAHSLRRSVWHCPAKRARSTTCRCVTRLLRRSAGLRSSPSMLLCLECRPSCACIIALPSWLRAADNTCACWCSVHSAGWAAHSQSRYVVGRPLFLTASTFAPNRPPRSFHSLQSPSTTSTHCNGAVGLELTCGCACSSTRAIESQREHLVVCGQGPQPPSPMVVERFQQVISQLFQQVRCRRFFRGTRHVTAFPRGGAYALPLAAQMPSGAHHIRFRR